jgi:hypothetical protein
MVEPQNRILNADAAWCTYDGDYARYDNPEPSDTYDGADIAGGASWGVVDDTSDGIVRAHLQYRGNDVVATARLAVAPPDYAPDRRFFLTLADDLCDRDAPLIEDPTADEIADLFQRVYETLSLQNVDYTRDRALNRDNASYDLPHPATPPREDTGSLTRLDTVDDEIYAIKAPPLLPRSQGPAIPPAPPAGTYGTIARGVHEPLADELPLLDFLRSNADRVRKLIRPPWAAFTELQPTPGIKPRVGPRRDPRRQEDQAHDMRMPPYMRDESPFALSLTRREYLMIERFLELSEGTARAKGGARLLAAEADTDERLLGAAERHLREVVLRRRGAERRAR